MQAEAWWSPREVGSPQIIAPLSGLRLTPVANLVSSIIFFYRVQMGVVQPKVYICLHFTNTDLSLQKGTNPGQGCFADLLLAAERHLNNETLC